MPVQMQDPDHNEVLEIPDDGVASMKALGWTELSGGSRHSSSDSGDDGEERSRRRPRKTE